MKCVICDKELEDVGFGNDQPHAGGYVKMTFTYGSAKFDNAIGRTEFDGHICDSCAEPLTTKMIESRFGFDGEKLEGEEFRVGSSVGRAQD